MSPFLPWSEKSKGWEFHAEDLRDLVPRPAEAGSLPFDPWELAPCVGLRVVECRFGGLDAAERAYLSGGASSHWSGGVLPVLLPDGSRVCMLNPDHSYRRKKITLMEEICHCYLGHVPSVLTSTKGARFRDFNRAQEEE